MEPSDQEKLAIIDLGSLLTWAAMPEVAPAPVGDQVLQSPRDAFLASIGATAATHYRLLAVLTAHDFEQVLGFYAVNGNAPSAIAMMAARLAHCTARRLCQLDPWPAAAAAAAAQAAACAAQAAAAPAGAAAFVQGPLTRIKISNFSNKLPRTRCSISRTPRCKQCTRDT